MAKVSVTLSHRPDKPVEMDEGDVPQLRHQGLVISVTPVPAAAAPKTARARKAPRTPAAAKAAPIITPTPNPTEGNTPS